MRHYLLAAVLMFSVLSVTAVADKLDNADAAVANILFDYEGSEQFATYIIKEDGFVDITFARNMPDKLYSEILAKLNNHPDINGVLAGKGGPVCTIW